ncbi:MAG: type III-A CRISPR-associated protein Csm2 [Candidatus Omnitrophica bacterium]|nr:type III-A CRISPR-associated protein Csm2 [Candidatus Omnitrophota bacterium]MCM8825815.1 type III-A CRISPR-associated protein Csm2 [Candidatus Omnitrophota bacterium]MCM8827664.1 type III-A CRISPR-associated protein Csm2 [Candidatus Omnitrophota bacterium]
MSKVDRTRINKIINAGDVTELNSYAEELAKEFAPNSEREKKKKLTTSQIRNILDNVQRMSKEGVEKGEYELLRPKLAYVAGRSDKENYAVRDLREILDIALQNVGKDYRKFENFRNFLEAIVGYHKFYSQVKD